MGIDIWDRWCVASGFDRLTGEVLPHRRIRTDPDELDAFFESLPSGVRTVIETGTHSPWISRLSQRHGHETLVGQARKLRAIWQNDRKSDEHDADILWQLGDARPELLSPIEHRSERAQQHLAVVRLREQVVRARRALISAVRGTVKATGHRLPKCTPESFHRAIVDDVPADLAPAVLPMLAAIGAITDAIRDYDREVLRLCREEYRLETRRLLEVHGVGHLTALAFVLVLDDPKRFKKSRDVGAYVGLVPRRDQSGDTDKQLPISKAGDRLLRKLLVQCAHHIAGPFGKECDLRRWALPRLEAGGKSQRKKTLVGVARRLAVTLHRLWLDDAPYDPSHQQSRTRAAAA